MRTVLKSVLLIAVALSVIPGAVPTARAFDIADYQTTYLATRDAYMRAKFMRDRASVRYQFMRGVMALYGHGEGIAVADTEALTRYKLPSWCRTGQSKLSADPAAVWPERVQAATSFVVGHQYHANAYDINALNPGLYATPAERSYLHFHTAAPDSNAISAVQAFMSFWPYKDPALKTAALTAFNADVERYHELHGRNAWLGEVPTHQEFYQRVFGPGAQYDTTVDREAWGNTCDTDTDCPGGGTCEATTNWYQSYLGYPNACRYQSVRVDFPPPAPGALGCGNDLPTLFGMKNMELDGRFARYGIGAYDIEQLATYYRATRDAYLKAKNELFLATPPYMAARDAYVAAVAVYGRSLYE